MGVPVCQSIGEIGAKSVGLKNAAPLFCPRLLFFAPFDLAALYVERLLPLEINRKKI